MSIMEVSKMQPMPFTFKIASEEWEFDKIHKLNYKTFVEEIPQHPHNPDQTLVDKFHHENTYLICLRDDQLVGMVAIRDKRPFSLDGKLRNLKAYLPPHRSICELRLLAVEKDHRSRIFPGIMLTLAQYCERNGYDLAIMSGTVRQLKLYKHLRFVPFGPLVGTTQAQYQPMYLTLGAYEELKQRSRTFAHAGAFSSKTVMPINLLPGPVAICEPVRKTYRDLPVSHRSKVFMEKFAHTKHLLCQLVGSQSVEIFMGSGTLANDVIAGQLSLLRRPGLMLTNGEFGNRLIDHASRFGLSFRVLRVDWSHLFNRNAIQRMLKENTDIGWLWAVHCETSSGILNDLALLQELTTEKGILLCLDCTSSLGTVPTDLSGVYLASSVSGKGLGAFPGLSMVFYNHKVSSAPNELPRYLDLGLYASSGGVPFTISSNLVYALRMALMGFESKRFDEIIFLSSWLRSRLSETGFQLIGPKEHTSPAVITIVLPESVSSENVGDQLQEAGYLPSYRSEYLLERNWIQFCLMGECTRETLVPLIDLLAGICVPHINDLPNARCEEHKHSP